MDAQQTPRRAIRLEAVKAHVPLSTSKIYDDMAKGKFPKCFRLSGSKRAVAWWEDEVLQWLADQAAARDVVGAA